MNDSKYYLLVKDNLSIKDKCFDFVSVSFQRFVYMHDGTACIHTTVSQLHLHNKSEQGILGMNVCTHLIYVTSVVNIHVLQRYSYNEKVWRNIIRHV